jgi:hypothetical protein
MLEVPAEILNRFWIQVGGGFASEIATGPCCVATVLEEVERLKIYSGCVQRHFPTGTTSDKRPPGRDDVTAVPAGQSKPWPSGFY